MNVKFEEIIGYLEKVEKTSSKKQKTVILSEMFNKLDQEDKKLVVYLINGQVWPQWEGKELGVSENLLFKVFQNITGSNNLKDIYVETGDIGDVATWSIQHTKQKTFFKTPLTLGRIYHIFDNIASVTEQSRKIKLIQSLFLDASDKEAKYLARIITGSMRTGAADGIIRDALASVYNVSPEKVERALMITSDWRKVIDALEEKKIDEVEVTPGNPVMPMLAEVAKSIPDGLSEHKETIIETKYDGARVQIHKTKNGIKIYSRRLEDVTNSLPEIVNAASKLPGEFIIEGEAIAINNDGKVLPFQYVLRRFRRKHDVSKIAQEIKFELRAFDAMYIGKSLIDEPLKTRRAELEKLISKDETGILHMSDAIVTHDENETRKFYEESLSRGHEGIMIKDFNSTYEAGKRGKKWLKVKPLMEPLDLVITAAERGTGKRAGLLGAFEVSVIDEETGEFLPVGKVGTGFTDDDLKEFTKMLEPLIIEDDGNRVILEPKIMITVAYQEIQKSPKYKSGYALRFPRYVGLREDKDSPDTLQRLERLYRIYSKV